MRASARRSRSPRSRLARRSGRASRRRRTAARTAASATSRPKAPPRCQSHSRARAHEPAMSRPGRITAAAGTAAAERECAQEADRHAERGQRRPSAARMPAGHSCAPAAASLRGSPRKTMPKALAKQAAARPPIIASASDRDDGRQARGAGSGAVGQPAERPEVDQELADEAVQRRQARDGGRADQEASPRSCRHALDQPAEAVDVARAGGVQHRAGAEEQQALEDGVVHDVQQPAAMPRTASAALPVARPDQPEAEAERDDADVLDAVVGEQALEVVLGQREQHAEDARDRPDADQRPAPPGLGRSRGR